MGFHFLSYFMVTYILVPLVTPQLFFFSDLPVHVSQSLFIIYLFSCLGFISLSNMHVLQGQIRPFLLKIFRTVLIFLTPWLCIHLPSLECLHILFLSCLFADLGKTQCFNYLKDNYHIIKGWIVFIISADKNSLVLVPIYLKAQA